MGVVVSCESLPEAVRSVVSMVQLFQCKCCPKSIESMKACVRACPILQIFGIKEFEGRETEAKKIPMPT